MVEYYFVLLSRETCERQYDFSKVSNKKQSDESSSGSSHRFNIKILVCNNHLLTKIYYCNIQQLK